MDDALKKDFDSVCNELGITMSTAVVILAKKMSREKRIPFDVSIDPFYSESNLKALDKSIEQLKARKTVKKIFDELDVFSEVDQETKEYA